MTRRRAVIVAALVALVLSTSSCRSLRDAWAHQWRWVRGEEGPRVSGVADTFNQRAGWTGARYVRRTR